MFKTEKFKNYPCIRFVMNTILVIFLQSFVLVDGPIESRLDTTEADPNIEFTWNGSVPRLANLSQYKNGAWVDLTNKQVMQNLIKEALDTWSNITGAYIKLKLTETDETTQPDEFDNLHLISVNKIKSSTSAAYAIPISKDGIIIDCDIIIGDHLHDVKGLAITLTHEIGHCLGLGHPHTSQNSIMSYRYARNDVKLSTDDKAGIIYLYPDSEFNSSESIPLTCGSVLGNVSDNHMHVVLLLIVLCIPLVLRALSLLFVRRKFGGQLVKIAIRAKNEDK